MSVPAQPVAASVKPAATPVVSKPITKEDILAGKSKSNLKVLVNGNTGTGKTYLCMTAPRWAYVGIEPAGLDTARANPQLLENMVMAEEFMPSPTENIKQVFERMDLFIDTAHARAKAGELDTLIVDNVSYLSENRWMYINKFERDMYKTQTGAFDVRSAYGELGRWLYMFTLTKVLSFQGNVFMTAHEMKEDDEELTKRVDPTIPIMPNILGGFRNKVAGMFSASIYLDKRKIAADEATKKPAYYRYSARCQKGNQRDAKNRYNLPEVIDNISYQAIVDAASKGKAA